MTDQVPGVSNLTDIPKPFAWIDIIRLASPSDVSLLLAVPDVTRLRNGFFFDKVTMAAISSF